MILLSCLLLSMSCHLDHKFAYVFKVNAMYFPAFMDYQITMSIVSIPLSFLRFLNDLDKIVLYKD